MKILNIFLFTLLLINLTLFADNNTVFPEYNIKNPSTVPDTKFITIENLKKNLVYPDYFIKAPEKKSERILFKYKLELEAQKKEEETGGSLFEYKKDTRRNNLTLLGQLTDEKFFLDENVKEMIEPVNKPISQLKIIKIEEYKKKFNLIVSLHERKFYKKAVEEIDKLLKYDLYSGERIKLLFLKGDSLIGDENYSEAEKLFRSIDNDMKYDLYRSYITYYLARSLHLQDKFEDAVTEYLRVYKYYPDKIITDDALYAAAEMLHNNNRDTEAVKYYTIIVEDYAEADFSDDALFSLAQLYDRDRGFKNYYTAVNYYKKLYNIYPRSVFANKAMSRAKHLRENFL